MASVYRFTISGELPDDRSRLRRRKATTHTNPTTTTGSSPIKNDARSMTEDTARVTPGGREFPTDFSSH